MIIATFKETAADKNDKSGIISRRWALDVGLGYIGLAHQVKFADNRYLMSNGGYYYLTLGWRFRWGLKELGKYDGKHRAFDIGCFSLVWVE